MPKGKSTPRASAGEPSKVELQRQLEESRENISETVSEIKEVVTQQYEEIRETVDTVKEGVSEALDWGEEFRKNPVVWGAGAVSVGILIGLGLAHALDDSPPSRRRKSRPPGTGERLIGELSGLADAVLPTISGKVKEMFGVDLTAYLPGETASPRPATKRLPAKKSAAKKRPAKKTAAPRRARKAPAK